MPYTDDFRRCLLEMDVVGVRKLWSHVAPHLANGTDEETLASLHYARTAADSIPIKLRAYSHHWLLDHNLPSGLPDNMKPLAERIYPRIVEGVGISVNASSDLMRPIVPLVRRAMEDAVNEAYAEFRHPPVEHVRERMKRARGWVISKLLGIDHR